MKTRLIYFVLAACVVLVLFIGYINIDSLIENFGDGPPYYGRTTNMDKWEDPIPTLLAIDIVAAIVIVLVGKWAVRSLRRPPLRRGS